MTEFGQLFKNKESSKSQFDEADKAFSNTVCAILDGLLGTQKGLVRNLELIKLCNDIDPGFKIWLEDKFYKYEGGVVDKEDISSLGSSVLKVLGYEEAAAKYRNF